MTSPSSPPSAPLQRAPLPSYGYMVFILGALACLGPLTIDAYLPAFGEIGKTFERSQQDVQGTLGFYMLAYAVTTLLHGTLSDTFGRRRILLIALGIYTVGSMIAAWSPTFEWLIVGRVLQGLSAGAGMIIGQAMVNDCYQGAIAQRTLSYIIMVFSVSPAVAPIIGGYLAAGYGWRTIFIFMTVFAVASMALCAWGLPETLPRAHRQPFAPGTFFNSIGRILQDRIFVAYSLAFGLLFASFGFMIGGAHDFVTHVLGLAETDFGYLFIPLVAGMLSGSGLAARLARSVSAERLIGAGYVVMALSVLCNLAYTASVSEVALPWAVAPLALYACGITLALPSMTLTVLRRVPGLGGTAASVLGFIQMVFFSIVSGWGVAMVYGSAWRMAIALAVFMLASGAAWFMVHHRAARAPVEAAR